jgi:hypothetical protein
MNFLKSQDLSVSIPIIKRIRTVIGQQINLNKMDGMGWDGMGWDGMG